MKPDDSNGSRDIQSRPYRVLLIAGSDRRQYNCPGGRSHPESSVRSAMSRRRTDSTTSS